MAPAVATYEPYDPRRTVLYKVIADHLETFLASLDADPDATGLPAYVQREFYDYLQCGILAHSFLRLGCDTTLPKLDFIHLSEFTSQLIGKETVGSLHPKGWPCSPCRSPLAVPLESLPRSFLDRFGSM